MTRIVLLILLALTGTTTSLIAGEYPVLTIPKELLKSANAVIRLEEQTIEIVSLGKIRVKDRYVITILNEAGERWAIWGDYYDKMHSIESIEGTLYDAMGNKIRSMKKSEISDEAATSSINLADDNRVKSFSFHHRSYPYTVEFASETTDRQSMFLPNWAPVPGRNIAVEKSFLSIITDGTYEVRYKAFNYPDKPLVSQQGNKKVYKWEVRNQVAVEGEYASGKIHEVAPYITFSPSKFKIDDYEGSMSSWKEFGLFMNNLNEGTAELPQPVKDKVRSIVSGLKTDREKTEALYRFLQENTRYISVQLGIGGWKPFPASYVAERKYGDCKALSNYMTALLKEAGIKSYYALIRAGEGERDMFLDFPNASFNHAVCCVPLGKDTVWLECTSQTEVPGYMGSFTGNRHALLITENGGVVAATPTYNLSSNLRTSNVQVMVQQDGQIDASLVNIYHAQRRDDLHQLLNSSTKTELLDHLKENLDIANYEIVNFDYKEDRSIMPFITEKLQISARHYVQVSGKRMFVTPNLLNKWDIKLNADTARKYDIVLNVAERDLDTVQVIVPQGYEPESIPKPIELTNAFGKFSARAEWRDQRIYYYRSLERNAGKFPAKDYQALVQFYESIYKADRSRIVLVKKVE
ncbi:DUF3857 and transglutaminase domain-containing protein [Flavihumibacter rivuli]|uniref:DUF3857 domain-containing transglutaminase family protein n=1 Tax=Flavihumibacter rivuli TaxID=2838156 RepID=UPI001BDE49EA|nr:DUF3857 and transglutaminase domain-containing protein [Flavihumibacter rivuli]ULQ57352.1 DUF3857 and transglutaminase domain-containing protein [Flavihumibacter rivuli]